MEYPRLGTVASREFYLAYGKINSFLMYLVTMATEVDRASEAALKSLVQTARTHAERERIVPERRVRRTAIDELKRQRQFLIEIILVRHIENYLNFLSSLLFEIFVQRPETLRSSEKIEIDAVLEHDSIESFARMLAERRVESLSYSSFQKLAEFFEDRFRLTLFDPKDVPFIVEAIETRNISVHNRCIINKRYLSRTGQDETLLGKVKTLGIDQLNELVPKLHASVKQVDADARRRLKLRGVRYDVRTTLAKEG